MSGRFLGTLFLIASVSLPGITRAESGSGLQFVTTYETQCHDEPTTVLVPTGNKACETTSAQASPSADFSGSSDCTDEMIPLDTTEEVCKRVAVTKPVRTPVATEDGGCRAGGCGGRGDSPGT
ncbi:hypothetical protein D3C71_451560 [compost metagenome]